MLAGPGKDCLAEPERLKYLLAPILAKSGVEQGLFYGIFDQYYAEICTIPAELQNETAAGISGFWKILALSLLAVALLVGAFLYFSIAPNTDTAPTLNFTFQHAGDRLRSGDTLRLLNTSEPLDTAKFRFVWQINDRQNAYDPLHKVESTHTQWIARSAGNDHVKAVQLTAFTKKDNRSAAQITKNITVHCSNPPEVDSIDIKPSKNASYELSVAVIQEKKLNIQWDFGDGTPTEMGKATVRHRFPQGKFTVTCTIARVGSDGLCETKVSKEIDFGRDRPVLPIYPLEMDNLEIVAILGKGFYLLLGLLLMGTGWFFYHWLKRKAPEPLLPAAESKGTPIPVSNDRPPYDIPFRMQEGNISIDRAAYRLAQAMMRREESERSTIDVAASVRATIAGGGFPLLRNRKISNPCDYLILLDEQSAESHLAQLFKYLVGLLRGQDVVMEVFTYRTELHHFWNRHHPEGVGIELLQRLYPNHRLILLGDAHAMLDPFPVGLPALKRELAMAFTPWKRRVMLTPMPPVSWTYQEQVLSRLFAVFPCDLRGQTEAATFFENDGQLEDLPVSFDQWQTAQARPRPTEPDINYRTWRTAAAHADYLRDHPGLFRWLCALAVYPRPTWPLTIAIGLDLSKVETDTPRDFEVDFDSLLILSRIPWLQNAQLDPRLRQELLDQLDPTDERLAREAVVHELDAVAHLSKDGFADVTRETNLAVQRFALEPTNQAHQATVRALIDAGLVNRRVEMDLNQIVRKHVAQTTIFQQSNVAPDQPEASPDIHAFLAEQQENQPEALPPQRPLWTKDLQWAILLGALLILLTATFLILEQKGRLHEMFFGKQEPTADALRDYFFVKEAIVLDSAVVYNNNAVQYFQSTLEKGEDATVYRPDSVVQREGTTDKIINIDQKNQDKQALGEANRSRVTMSGNYQFAPNEGLATAKQTLQLLEKARQFRKNAYGIAQSNGEKTMFNIASGVFNSALSPDTPPDSMRSRLLFAMEYFGDTAAAPNFKMEARHALGLCYYYLSQKDLATIVLNGLLSDSLGRQFLATTEVKPNLQALLNIQQQSTAPVPLPVAINGTVRDGLTQKPIPNAAVSVVAGNKGANYVTVKTDLKGNFSIRSKEIWPDPLYLSVVAPMYRPYLNPLLNRSGRIKDVFLVGIKDKPRSPKDNPRDSISFNQNNNNPNKSGAEPDRDGDGVPDGLDKCPDVKGTTSADGCPPVSPIVPPSTDTDQDGIPDEQDECPRLKGSIENKGCPPYDLLKVHTIKEGETLRSIALKYNIELGELARSNGMEANDRILVGKKILIPDAQQIDKAVIDQINENMVTIPAGTFEMGCDEKIDGNCQKDELQHTVQISSFRISKYEVTQAQWRAIMGSDPTGLAFKDCDNCPVENVSWDEVQAFIQKLNDISGRNYRLPTEAEWEYAARGGPKDRYNRYAGGNSLEKLAWFSRNANGKTYPVGQKAPNALGLHDMAGNVWEWCQDWYGSYETAADKNQQKNQTGYDLQNPKGPTNGSNRVKRGGSWYSSMEDCRSAARSSEPSQKQSNDLGFRLALGMGVRKN